MDYIVSYVFSRPETSGTAWNLTTWSPFEMVYPNGLKCRYANPTIADQTEYTAYPAEPSTPDINWTIFP